MTFSSKAVGDRRVGICIMSVGRDSWHIRGFLTAWEPGDPHSPWDNGKASWGTHDEAVVFKTIDDAMAAIIQLHDHEGLGRIDMLDNVSLDPIISPNQILRRPPRR